MTNVIIEVTSDRRSPILPARKQAFIKNPLLLSLRIEIVLRHSGAERFRGAGPADTIAALLTNFQGRVFVSLQREPKLEIR